MPTMPEAPRARAARRQSASWESAADWAAGVGWSWIWRGGELVFEVAPCEPAGLGADDLEEPVAQGFGAECGVDGGLEGVAAGEVAQAQAPVEGAEVGQVAAFAAAEDGVCGVEVGGCGDELAAGGGGPEVQGMAGDGACEGAEGGLEEEHVAEAIGADDEDGRGIGAQAMDDAAHDAGQMEGERGEEPEGRLPGA